MSISRMRLKIAIAAMMACCSVLFPGIDRSTTQASAAQLTIIGTGFDGVGGGVGVGAGGSPTVVVGGATQRATVWDSVTNTMTLLPLPVSSHSMAFGRGVSADGSTVIGLSFQNSAQRGFQYNVAAGGSPTALALPTGTTRSDATDLSANGQTIVGTTSGGTGGGLTIWNSGVPTVIGTGQALPSMNDAATRIVSHRNIWNKTSSGWVKDSQTIQNLQGFNSLSTNEMSGDGRYVYGKASNKSGGTIPFVTLGPAFIWDTQTPTVAPTVVPNMCGINASNYDGSVLVGGWGSGVCTGNAYWSPSTGTITMENFLSSHGVDLTGWTIADTTGVSADGKTFAGWGFYGGDKRQWVTTIPEPSSGCLFGMMATFGLFVRRLTQTWA